MLRYSRILVLASALSFYGSLAFADSITKPHTFASGDTIKSSEVNANFDTVYGQVNEIREVISINSEKTRIGFFGESSPSAPLDVPTYARGSDQGGFMAFSIFGSLQIGMANVDVLNDVETSPVLIPRSSNQDMIFSTFVASVPIERMRILNNGNIGIGTASPSYPLHIASGAYVTTGGVWTNASSREFKENILNLSIADAQTTLAKLNPVTFAYKKDPAEKHVGFIAEDVPDLLATNDRKGLSAMDVVAVVTKVVQEQQAEIQALKKRNEAMEAMLQKTLAGIASLKQEVNHLKSDQNQSALNPVSF